VDDIDEGESCMDKPGDVREGFGGTKKQDNEHVK
jgi:hypothetical protein